MKLVLLSGGQNPSNRKLHQAVVDLVPKTVKHKSFTYIPFCSEYSDIFYNRSVRRYRALGVERFQCLPVDAPMDPRALKKALQSDIIYLAGGNTFYFLKHLRQSKMLPHLTRFVKRGGVLAGLSAGAIIMTPNIGLAGVPSYDADENEVGLKDFTSLGLVDFEFFPHFMPRSKRLIESLKRYSMKTKNPVYASEDGCGIAVTDQGRDIFGKLYGFDRGRYFQL